MQPNKTTLSRPTPPPAAPQPIAIKPNVQYGQGFFVLHNPGRFLRGQLHVTQGILVIQESKLIFADIKGHSFSVPLTEPIYSVNSNHNLVVRLANGERWGFTGLLGSSGANPQTIQLAAQYGIERDTIGGVDTRVQSYAKRATMIEGMAVGAATQVLHAAGGVGGVGVDGIGLAAEIRGTRAGARNILEGYAKVDQFVVALRACGITVSVDKPNLITWNAYMASDPKKFRLFLIMNPIVIFIIAWVAFIGTVGQIPVIHAKTNLALILCTVLALLVNVAGWKLLRHLTAPYKASSD